MQAIRILLCTLVATGVLATAAHADSGEKSDAAKYRHEVMEAMGSSFGNFILLYMNKVDQPDAHLIANAQALALSASLTADLVPAGSEGGEALPAIWDEMDEYQKYAEEVANNTAALADAAEAGDKAAMGKAFKAAGKSCKGCHDKFREEHDH